jgi:outer membrane protein insertion porin family
VEGRKYLDIQVEEKRTGSLNFGAGFSTVDSLIGFIELTQGNFDITNWPSLTGGGQKFRIRLQGGTQRKDVELALTEPWFMDRPISVGFTSFYHEANYLSSIYDQRNYGFSLDVRKGIRPFLYGSLGYRLESVDTFNVVVTASPQLLAETGPSTKSVFTANPAGPSRFMASMSRHLNIGVCRGIPFYWSTPKLRGSIAGVTKPSW